MDSAAVGYRRRILIEPAAGYVTAELEDDYHRMVVTLHHAAGVVTQVESEMKRRPWTTCPGAMAQLEQTFTGVAIADFVARGDKKLNCTHLYDLALFAAAHAEEGAPVAYDVLVTDAVDGQRIARLWRDGALLLDWRMKRDRFLAPDTLAGTRMTDLGGWIATQDRVGAEAGRILRWASIIAQGRGMDIPAGLSATAFPPGACYTFQPDVARISTRLAGADVDFSEPGAQPLADRAAAFEQA